MQRKRILIVGGGIIGLASAHQLQRSGAAAVTIIDKGECGAASSSQITGGIRALFPTPTLIALSFRAQNLLEAWQSSGGHSLGPVRSGYVYVASTPEQMSRLERNADVQLAAGADVRLVGPEEIARLVRGMDAAGAIGAAYSASAGLYSPRALVSSLKDACRAAGVEFIENEAVSDLVLKNGVVRQVRTEHRTLEADAVLIAAAGWTPRIVERLGVHLPIVPTVGRVYRTKVPATMDMPGPLVVDMRTGLYFRSNLDGLVLGGIDPDVAPSPEPRFSTADAGSFAAIAASVLPGLAGVELRDGWAGVRDMTPDDTGVIGEILPGSQVHVAAGFGGHGFMHALAIAELVEAAMFGTPTEIGLAPFSAERFAGAGHGSSATFAH